MRHVELHSGDRMPILGLGTWKSKPGEVYEAVKAAVKMGYRHLDCAWIYGNEAEIGQALAELFAEGVVTREEMWLTSKLWNDAHDPDDVEPALQSTLTNLQIDYLDLYLIHWPIAHKKGVIRPTSGDDMLSLHDVPLIATWRSLESCVDRGVCRNIGVSNFSLTKLQALLERVRITPATNQVELHPYLQQDKLRTFCHTQRIWLTAYSPLGSNDRPKGLKTEDEPILLKDPTIAEVAHKHGITPAQVLLSWAIYRDTIVIPKSVNPGRMQENLNAADILLDPDDADRIASLDRGRRYVSGTFWVFDDGPYTLSNLWDP